MVCECDHARRINRKGEIMQTKKQAELAVGGLTRTSKMPAKSYSLPTAACITGAKMARVPGSVCADCYAMRGFYKLYGKTIRPAQAARLVALTDPEWIPNMIRAIGTDKYFRWHDSGDIQSANHLESIALVCRGTPSTRHWLPTREYAMVAQWLRLGGRIPDNLIIRLSAMFPDMTPNIPKSLRGVPGIAISSVHTVKPMNHILACVAPLQGNKCGDCRACWSRDVKSVSYLKH
jgi:hypothetical protein